jgi:hypothetical protein
VLDIESLSPAYTIEAVAEQDDQCFSSYVLIFIKRSWCSSTINTEARIEMQMIGNHQSCCLTVGKNQKSEAVFMEKPYEARITSIKYRIAARILGRAMPSCR